MLRVSESWLEQILATLHEHHRASRSQITEATGLNPGSVSRATRYLLDRNVVWLDNSDGRLRAGMGRKPAVLKLNPDSGYFLCVDLEGTRVRAGIVDLTGAIRYRWSVPVAVGEPFSERLLVQGIEKVRSHLSPQERSKLLAAGVSYTGIMNRQGEVTASNLAWKDYPLKKKMAQATALRTFFGSESFVKLMAERWRGAARGVQNCVFVSVANGIGCAIMSEGRLVLGRDGAAGELGHVVVDPDASDRCQCGRTGCLEAIASSPNIVRQYLAKIGAVPPRVFGEQVVQVFERARDGDKAALEVIERAGRLLGLALSNLANLVNPEIILMGGDIVYGDDLILPHIREAVARNCLPAIRHGLQVTTGALGLDAGLIGAAAIAFHGVLQDRTLLKLLCSGSEG